MTKRDTRAGTPTPPSLPGTGSRRRRRRWTSGLTARLIGLGLAMLVPLLAVAAYRVDNERNEAQNAALQRIDDYSATVAGAAQTVLAQTQTLLSTLAASSSVTDGLEGQADACGHEFARTLESASLYANLVVADADGTVSCTAAPLPEPVNLANTDYFAGAMANQAFTVGGISNAEVTEGAELGMATPINRDGATVGVVVAAFDLHSLSGILGGGDLPEGSSIAIVDGDSRVLARWPDGDTYLGETLPHPIDGAASPEGRSSIPEHTDVDGIKRLSIVKPISGDDMSIVVGVPKSAAMAPAAKKLRVDLIAVGAGMILAVLLGYAGASRWLVGPLRRLTRTAERLGRGDLTTRTGARAGTDELARLAVAIDDMAESLQGTTERNRQIVTTAQEGITTLDRRGRVTFINPALATMLRVDADAAVGRRATEFVAPDDRDSVRIRLDQRDARPGRREVQLQRTDGTTFTALTSGAPLLDDHGDLSGALVMVTDIDQQIRSRRELEFQAQILGAANEAVIAIGLDHSISYWNPAAEELYGWTAEEAIGRRLDDIFSEDQATIDVVVEALLSDGRWTGELEAADKHGSRVPTRMSAALVLDQDGQPLGMIGVITDISALKAAERDADERAATQLALGRLSRAALMSRTSEEVIHGAVDLVKEVLAVPAVRIVSEGLNRGHRGPIDPEATRIDFPIDGADERLGTLEVFLADEQTLTGHHRDFLGGVSHVLAVALARFAADRELEHLAVHDPLTGLANRTLLINRIEHAAARQARAERTFAILFLDLDRFKMVNDGLGHAVGDKLLIRVGERLRTACREIDTVARLGGDEFAVLIEDLDDVSDAVEAASRIVEVMRTPFEIDGSELVVTISVGIVMASASGCDLQTLLQNADVALYAAKAAGRDRYLVFNGQMQNLASSRLATVTALRRAIEQGEFRLRYQPVVHLDGEEVAVEALLRWEHPDRGLLAPGEFIEIAEDSGLIVPIGAWVLAEACRQLRTWRDAAPNAAPSIISVNLAPRQLFHPDIFQHVESALEAAGLEPTSLMLELTETAFAEEPEQARQVLDRLKHFGVHLAIDDFGTGYSSLGHLKNFPVDVLKIDRSFVQGIPSDAHDYSIVETTVQLAHSLGLQAVAEGIETDEQASAARAAGCDYGQGYLWARPLEAEDVIGWIGSHREALAAWLVL